MLSTFTLWSPFRSHPQSEPVTLSLSLVFSLLVYIYTSTNIYVYIYIGAVEGSGRGVLKKMTQAKEPKQFGASFLLV